MQDSIFASVPVGTRTVSLIVSHAIKSDYNVTLTAWYFLKYGYEVKFFFFVGYLLENPFSLAPYLVCKTSRFAVPGSHISFPSLHIYRHEVI